MDHRMECLIDAAFADQSPMLVDTKYRVSSFPTQASPDTNTIKASTQNDRLSSLKREQVRNMLGVQNKRNKAMVRPASSMLLFLRESYIAEYSNEYTNSNKARGPSINNNSKIAGNAWKWDHKFNWGPFKVLQPKLSGGAICDQCQSQSSSSGRYYAVAKRQKGSVHDIQQSPNIEEKWWKCKVSPEHPGISGNRWHETTIVSKVDLFCLHVKICTTEISLRKK